MKYKTLLLTGATGFLGSHLLEALLHEGYHVVILKRSTSDTWRIKHLLEQCTSYDVDQQALDLAFQDQHIDAVIHTACHYGRNDDPISAIVESNLMFGLRVLETAIAFNTDTFFNTDTLLQKHLNVYTLSKKQFVEWLQQQSDKIQVVNLKLEHMYGPKDDQTKFVSWLISQFEMDVSEIPLTEGTQKRDFIYIEDVVSAYITLLSKTESLPRFSEFDVGTGALCTVRSFVETLKHNYELVHGAVNTKLNFGARPYREGEMMEISVNNSELRELGWYPKETIETGLKKLVESEK